VAIAAVQRASNVGVGVTALSVGAAQGWAAPAAGNLLVITINVDVVVSTPSGWTAGPSVVDDNAAYLYYKIAAGTESTISVTVPSTNGIITACEYSGATATPFDVQNSSTIAASPGSTTTSVSTTTTAANDLVFAAACLYDFNAAFQPAPTSPVWTNSFANVITQDVNPNAARHGSTFVAELSAGAAGAYATACSWSSSLPEARHQLQIAFKAAAVAPQAIVRRPAVVRQAVSRMANW
jgi:hypothetical protein